MLIAPSLEGDLEGVGEGGMALEGDLDGAGDVGVDGPGLLICDWVDCRRWWLFR